MYRIVWIKQGVNTNEAAYECVNTTMAINQFAAEGWEVVCVTPGTNASTWSGLFVTLRRTSP